MQQRFLFPVVVAAALLGWALSWLDGIELVGDLMELGKTIFLSVLKLIVAPLVFFSLLSGILRLRAASDLRRLSSATIFYYFSTTAIAIALGLFAVYWIHPWTQTPPPDFGHVTQTASFARSDLAEVNTVTALLTTLAARMFVNPFSALADLNILGIVTNGVIFALALLIALPKESAVFDLIHDVTLVIYRVASWAIWLVPVGVMAIVYQMSVQADASLLQGLVSFALLVVGMTLIHGLVVLPTIAAVVARRSPRELLRTVARPFVVALTTSSSAATLPVTFAAADELRINRSTSSFVLPLGATINMDGTALFEGIAAVYLAYVFGIPLDGVATATVFLVAMMASIGAPGIPSGSMAGMQMVLLAVGIPLEGIAILLLIERPLDTIRTAVNVEGDLVGSLVVERFSRTSGASEGEKAEDLQAA